MTSELYDGEILKILQKATTDAVNASIMSDLVVRYVGVAIKPPDNQKYLEILFIPNNRTDDFLGDEKNYRGLYRLILHWPNNAEGAYPAIDVLKSICSFFSKGMWLDTVKITVNPDMKPVIENGAELLYPAGLQYACFRP